VGDLKPYDDLFSRLLFDRQLREAVRVGGWAAAGAAADPFRDVDLDKLDALAAQIRDGLLRGQLGELGIGESFPSTIAALGGDPPAVVERFMVALHAAHNIDSTGRRAGVGVLEGFHTWAAGQLGERPDDRRRAQHELATALLATLARTPRPGFLIHWPFAHAIAGGWSCVLDAARPLDDPQARPEQPVAFRAAAGRLAIETVPLDIAAVTLERADDPPAWVGDRLAQLDPVALDKARTEAAARGLI
jgi:hypothetical protein